MRPAFKESPFDAAVMHFAVNDFCSCELSSLEFASLFDDIAEWLMTEFKVSVVYICQLFARPKPRDVSPQVYEDRRCLVNGFFETLLGAECKKKI